MTDIELLDMNNAHAMRLLIKGDSVSYSQMGQNPTLDDEAKRDAREDESPFPGFGLRRDTRPVSDEHQEHRWKRICMSC